MKMTDNDFGLTDDLKFYSFCPGRCASVEAGVKQTQGEGTWLSPVCSSTAPPAG